MSLTFSHLSAEGFEEEMLLKDGRKRARIRTAVSCAQCRSRKSRCNRNEGFPCKQCRDRGFECSFKPQKTSPARDVNTPEHTAANPWDLIPTGSGDARLLPATPRDAHIFRGSGRKTRIVGITHWTSPCNATTVLQSFLRRAQEFVAIQAGLNELKLQVRIYNVIPASLPVDGDNEQSLWSLLPNRDACEQYIHQYNQTYARLYNFIEPGELVADMHIAFGNAVTSNLIHLLRCLLAMSISMQAIESKRLVGRRIAYQVEHCIWFSRRLQKPCIGVMQMLLLLIISKTITSADADPAYDLLRIHGLASQTGLSMGINRDPALFDCLSGYHAEVRKRIWACFFRLNLDFCTQTGTQLHIRLEDCDCPLPSDSRIEVPASPGPGRQPCRQSQASAETYTSDSDASFNQVAMKLAKLVAPVHQILCSAVPRHNDDLQSELETSFRSFLDHLPPELRPGSSRDDAIQELQQAVVTITVHTWLLIISMANINRAPSSISQTGELLETWNYASSILSQFQTATQASEVVGSAAFCLLWSHAGRAALSACVLIGRLRNIDQSRMIPAHPESAASMFSELLTKLLSSMLELWLSRSHRGPVPIKTYVMLSICQAVTSNVFSDSENTKGTEQLYRRAVSSAEMAIFELKFALQQRQYPNLDGLDPGGHAVNDISDNADMEESSSAEMQFDDFAFLPDVAFPVDFSASSLSTDIW